MGKQNPAYRLTVFFSLNSRTMNKEKFKHLKQFFTRDLWRISEEEVTPIRRRVYTCLKIFILSIQQFINDRITVRASALTYSTLLSIIPILAILFAVAKGFGFDSIIETEFRSNLNGEQADLIITWIHSYLQHTKSGIFIGIGVVMLFWSVYILTDNIEQSFNSIWQVKRTRSMFRKLTDYFSMMLILPLLIVFSSGLTIFMSAYVKEMETFEVLAPVLQFLVQLIPYALTWGMFICLFMFIPNTKVKIRYTWLPGILAGSAFQAWQYFYINSQIWVSNYNAIYGSFAAIPLFLLWTQISWTICLVGAEISYVSQNLESFYYGKETANISRRYHDFFCTIILSNLCKRFEKGEKPQTAVQISTELQIPIRLTRKILYELQDVNLVYEALDDTHSNELIYLPGVDTNQLTLGLMLNRLDSLGSESFKIKDKLYAASWDSVMKARDEYLTRNDHILLKDL